MTRQGSGALPRGSVAWAIERLGACESKVRHYRQFGSDWEQAMWNARSDDLNWLVEKIRLFMSARLFNLVFLPCRLSWCTLKRCGSPRRGLSAILMANLPAVRRAVVEAGRKSNRR